MGKVIISILLPAMFAVVVVVTALLVDEVPLVAPTSNIAQEGTGGHESGTLLLLGAPKTPADAIQRKAVRLPNGPYIVIDTYCNRLFLRTPDTILLDALCSTGSGGELVDTLSGRRWRFETPPGIYTVNTTLVNPWWRKPDWAFIEEGMPVPKNESERFDDEMMGDYAIGFGDGYFIHGTIYERLLGKAVTHGCVRLAANDLKKLYDHTRIGTLIYVY